MPPPVWVAAYRGFYSQLLGGRVTPLLSSWQHCAGDWKLHLALAEPELARRVSNTVEEIARALETPSVSWWPPYVNGTDILPIQASLSGGYAGIALFFGYLALAREPTRNLQTTIAYLERAQSLAESVPMETSLFSGWVGVAWVRDHLSSLFSSSLFEPTDSSLAEACLDGLERARGPLEFDIVGGLSGLGIWALEVPEDPWRRRLAEVIVDRLDKLAVSAGTGRSWLIGRELMTRNNRRKIGNGYFDTGAAHGTAGVIAFLTAAATAGILPERCRALVEDSVSALLGQRYSERAVSLFPTIYVPGEGPADPCRLGWCYGEASIALALHRAGQRFRRGSWIAQANEIGRFAASRRGETTGVFDAGLCHGAGGLYVLFSRLYQATGDTCYLVAARHWLKQVLALRRQGEGVAGFRASYDWVNFDGSFTKQWNDQPGFLNGAAGVGLALLAAMSPVEPGWDRVLVPGRVLCP